MGNAHITGAEHHIVSQDYTTCIYCSGKE